MPKCEWCGVKYDIDEEEDVFMSEIWSLSYTESLQKCLCGKCAIEAHENMADGVFFETCEECGSRFDVMEDEGIFQSRYDGVDLRDFWRNKILCADCASEIAEDL